MKFSSEDLMKAMGLQVGDRVKIGDKIFEIYISPQNELRCVNIHNVNNHFYLKNLIDKEIEILPRPKRVGDTLCNNCSECPLGIMLCDGEKHMTLYEVLEYWSNDQEIYDLLKARLDKEVE